MTDLFPSNVCGRLLSGIVSCDGASSLGQVYKASASSATRLNPRALRQQDVSESLLTSMPAVSRILQS